MKGITLFCFLFYCITSYAVETAFQKGHVVAGKHRIAAAASNGQVDESLLQEAYHILESGDHDYKGHRMRAMHEIEAVAKRMGVNLHGDGPGRINQAASDEDLHHAQDLLQQASGGLRGYALKHIQQATKNLTIALSIR